MKTIFIKLITCYQRTLSPDHGPLRFFRGYGTCKFYPTCSDYTKQALKQYPMPTALYLAAKRLLRCNPFSVGGVDEVS